MTGRGKGHEWVPLALDLYHHPDVGAATRDAPGALGLFVCSILWSIDHDTAGFVPASRLADVCPGLAPVQLRRAAEALVEHGRWEPVAKGWLVHHFMEHQEYTLASRTRRRLNHQANERRQGRLFPNGEGPT